MLRRHEKHDQFEPARTRVPAVPSRPRGMVVPGLEPAAAAGPDALRGASMKALYVMALFAAGAGAGPGAPIGPDIPRGGGGTLGSTTSGVLAFLVQPNDVAPRSPLNPGGKGEAPHTPRHLVTHFHRTL